MSGYFEGRDRDPAYRFRLFEGHLLELQQRYRLALALRQAVDRLSQSALFARSLRKVRFGSSKGFMLGFKRRFAQAQTALAAQPVDYPAMRDGNQPWAEGPAWIVGVADSVDRQQYVLNRVLDIRRIAMVSGHEGAQVSGDLVEELPIGGLVALLGVGHQRRPCGTVTFLLTTS